MTSSRRKWSIPSKVSDSLIPIIPQAHEESSDEDTVHEHIQAEDDKDNDIHIENANMGSSVEESIEFERASLGSTSTPQKDVFQSADTVPFSTPSPFQKNQTAHGHTFNFSSSNERRSPPRNVRAGGSISKSNTSIPSSRDASSSHRSDSSLSHTSSASNIHKKNLEYIKNLESKKVSQRKKKDELRAKERGFQLYLNGANNEGTSNKFKRAGALSSTTGGALSGRGRPSNCTEQSINAPSTSTTSTSRRPRPRFPGEKRQRKNWSVKPIAGLQQQEISQLRQSISEWKKQKAQDPVNAETPRLTNQESIQRQESDDAQSSDDEDEMLLRSMQQSLDSDLMSKIMGKLKKLNKGKQKKLLNILSGLAEESDDEAQEHPLHPHQHDENDRAEAQTTQPKDASLLDFDDEEFQDDFDSFHDENSGLDVSNALRDLNEENVSADPKSFNAQSTGEQNNTSGWSESLQPQQTDSPISRNQTKNPLFNALQKTRDESKVNMWLARASEHDETPQSQPQTQSDEEHLQFSIHDNPQSKAYGVQESKESTLEESVVDLPDTMTELEKKILERPPSTAKRYRSPNRSSAPTMPRLPSAHVDLTSQQGEEKSPRQDEKNEQEDVHPPLSLRARRLARKRAKAQYNSTLMNPAARYAVLQNDLSATTSATDHVSVDESFDSLIRFKMNNLSRLFGKDSAVSDSASKDDVHRASVSQGKNVSSSHSYALSFQNPYDESPPKKDLASTHQVSSSSSARESRGYTPSFSSKRPRPSSRASINLPAKEEIDHSPPPDVAKSVKRKSTSITEEPKKFVIPTRPRGRELVINILTTWGDVHYVGLSGVEIFDSAGQLITLREPKKQLRADPPDINCLPQYQNDPRLVYNLFDGINKTCDDMHTWLAPFETARKHTISISLNEETTLGMIRIWNYNKSRIHSHRGARHIQIHLDDQLIFDGEVRRAPGTLNHAEQYAEHILYTDSTDAINNIEEYDDENYSFDEEEEGEDPRASISLHRPTTGKKDDVSSSQHHASSFSNLDPDMRPLTAASNNASKDMASSWDLRHSREIAKDTYIEAQTITIHLLESWGDRHYIGLTGLQLLDLDLNPLNVSMSQFDAVPKDMNSINGHSGDYRTLDKLINGANITQNDKNMWLIPSSLENDPRIEIDLGSREKLAGIRIYNYNKSEEDTARGVKRIEIDTDGKKLDEYDVRKAPGHDKFDFGHTILFAGGHSSAGTSNKTAEMHHTSSIYQTDIARAIAQLRGTKLPTPPQDCQAPLLPVGYVFKFRFLSTYGDFHYIGLNGIELFDARHQKIKLTADNLKASPDSVQKEVPGCDNDQRTLEKLIDGVNTTWDDRHMFLSPFTLGKYNEVYVIFSDPVALSCVKLWNYSKTPSRGVEEFEIYADDTLFYKGFMRMAPGAGGFNTAAFTQSILFTNDKAFIAKEYRNVYSRRGQDNHVALWNDGQPLARGDTSRKNTHAPDVRPRTMMTHHHQ
mmetsp:Transcript_2493/g.9382  ORF Transcript_2493/g.9382 Transcript_2493/m.9382 type:complete len:1478 (-) Transcript_2493:1894-6327(-)|eukprot:CAMPEP_0117453770 /NCGR_PEP_ID=MMETSP0759-20121206/10407_1 /TAXON_ID=63605 /ORGANISM="Percolomonas cosmopolitus, Strain WS" /LENGTH=1477 /DNA_ID=CAMNT_0005246837 /DNA_START=279 /DNA_END=4712 /DNA_ORIENTATION=-